MVVAIVKPFCHRPKIPIGYGYPIVDGMRLANRVLGPLLRHFFTKCLIPAVSRGSFYIHNIPPGASVYLRYSFHTSVLRKTTI